MSFELTPTQKSLRMLTHRIYHRFDRAQIHDPNHSLQLAGQAALASEGNVFVITHFGTGDLFPVLFELIFGTEGLAEKYTLSPQSFHQKKWLVSQIVRSMGSQFLPVINESAKKHPKLEKYSDDELSALGANLMSTFLSTSAQALSQGGSVVIAEATSRSAYLDMDGPNTLGLFLLAMKRLKTPPFGITPIGLSLENQVDYTQASGLNLNRTYVIQVGQRTLSSDHSPREIDIYLREELSGLVPESYRTSPRQ